MDTKPPHIYTSEGKGRYILLDDLMDWLKEKQINVPMSFNDVKSVYRYALDDIMITLNKKE